MFRGRRLRPRRYIESERFAALLADPAWLSANEVTTPLAGIKTVNAQQRSMAAVGLLLARLEASWAADETAARGVRDGDDARDGRHAPRGRRCPLLPRPMTSWRS